MLLNNVNNIILVVRKITQINFADIPVMSAYLILVAFIFVLINMTVDLLYFAVDPRLSFSGGRS